MTEARQQPQLFAARNAHFTVAVRVDGKRSHVEHHADFDAAMAAGRQWAMNDEVTWISINVREKRRVVQTHILVRRGDEIIVREQSGRLERVRRGSERKSGLVAPV